MSNNNNNNNLNLQGNIGTFGLTMSVLALSAPLMTVASIMPLVIAFGNNTAPITFIIITVMFLIFSVGFVKMGMVMTNPGGFYAYITAGLGKRMGLGVAFLATISYPFVGFVTCTYFGLTLNSLILNLNGPDIPWWIFALICIAINTWLAYHKIDLSAKVLSIVMTIEAIIVIVYDIACFAKGAPEGAGGIGLDMPWFTDAGLGVCVLFCIAPFIGFEATVIYREEVKDPEKTIPRATICAVIGIGVFYAIATWAMLAFEGVDRAQEIANNDMAGILSNQMMALFGKIFVDLSAVIIMISSLASNLSVHNVTARYLYSLGVDTVLPKALGRAHPRHFSPYVAASVVGIVWAVATILLGITGFDSVRVYSMSSGMGTFGVFFIMLLVSIAVVVYFKKNPLENPAPFSTLITPIISIVLLGVCTIVIAKNFDMLAGTTGVVSVILMACIILLIVIGYVYAGWLQNNKPDAYRNIGRQGDL